MILAFLIVILIGFCFINRLGGIFAEKPSDKKEADRTELIHLGFDTPCLAEDFISKMEEDDKERHPMEVIVYSGMKDDIMRMLLMGDLDYIVLMNPIEHIDTKKVKCKEVLLQPKSLKTSGSDIPIEMANDTSVKAVAFWIPGWMNSEEAYVSDLIMRLAK